MCNECKDGIHLWDHLGVFLCRRCYINRYGYDEYLKAGLVNMIGEPMSEQELEEYIDLILDMTTDQQ